MDLEELNKTQIILLTLLVSFVSAIATSIFTVKILENAPQAITQTINRVVERTIERVVPADPGSGGQTVIEKETTIVVKEEDLITESIERNRNKIVRLVQVTGSVPANIEDAEATGTVAMINEYAFHGIGVVVSSSGLIATAPALLEISDLIALTPNKEEHDITFVSNDGGVAVMQVEPNSEDDVISLSPVTFANEKGFKLGQTVVVLGGEERTSVSIGIIASLVDGDVSSGHETWTALNAVYTNTAGSIPGSPLVNIFGEVVGMDVLGIPGLFTPSNVLEMNIDLSTEPEELSESTEGDTETQEG